MKKKKSEKANLENKRSTLFLIGLVMALVVVLLAFEWKTTKSSELITLDKPTIVPEDDIIIPRTQEKKPEPPKKIVLIQQLKVVSDLIKINDSLEFVFPEAEDVMPIDFNAQVFASMPNEESEEIPYLVDEMPEFPGGERALLSYLTRNVHYPLVAQENGIQGRVYVGFIIDENGKVCGANIIRGVDEALDNEAIRVVLGMPQWKPGKQNGKALKVRYNVPIRFELK